jgi:hypothetical protein
MAVRGASAAPVQSLQEIGVAAIGVHFPKILLPKKGIVDFKKWAVVACDQYTSEEDYWQRVEQFVGQSPSTLNLTFPEVHLGKGLDDAIISHINKSMKAYEAESLLVETATPGAVLVERTFRDGIRRRGLVVALDLDLYEFSPNNSAPIRATEQTILERIPPRLKIRRGATLELPHILVLMDDPDFSVIEPLVSGCRDDCNLIYDTDLMENSGHIKGWWISDNGALQQLSGNLARLADHAAFNQKYGTSSKSPLVFAIGDGNHSLATAKALWEETKCKLSTEGGEFMQHPARFALVEIQNCHDPSLRFEPINRLIFDVKGGARTLLLDLVAAFNSSDEGPVVLSEGDSAYDAATKQMSKEVPSAEPTSSSFGYVLMGRKGSVIIPKPKKVLPLASLTEFIDDWLMKHPECKIDYVHETTAIDRYCSPQHEMNIGFVLAPMNKCDLFKTVVFDGILPRKTFSMGQVRPSEAPLRNINNP